MKNQEATYPVAIEGVCWGFESLQTYQLKGLHNFAR